MVIDAWTLYEEIQNKDKCKNCHRKLPNMNMKTKTACVWCDYKHWRKNNG